jgi:hypothetical protein
MPTSRIVHLLAVAALSACTHRPTPAPATVAPAEEAANDVIQHCALAGQAPPWDSTASRLPFPDLDPFRQCWYTEFLQALGEPRLYSTVVGQDSAFRLLLLPSFARAVAVRVFSTRGRYSLVVKTTIGPGGYSPRGIATRDSTALPRERWEHFQALLGEAQYWAAQTPDDGTGEDGTQWILEAEVPGVSHLRDEWSPKVPGPQAAYKVACQYLLDLGGVSPSAFD